MERERPLGLTIFGVLICGTSILQLISLVNYPFYTFMFRHFPESWMIARYTGSVILRVLGLAGGIGLLVGKEPFRKLVIVLSAYTIVTVYWKHPLVVFQRIAIVMERRMFNTPTVNDPSELIYPMFPWISMAVHYACDIGFALALIWYLSRPGIKEYFRNASC